MHRRNMVLGGIGLATMLLSGCDSTVGLDPTRTSFTKVIVPGACKVSDDVSLAELSVMLLDGTTGLVPDTRLNGEIRRVGELLEPDSFSFNKAPADLVYEFPQVGVATSDETDTPVGLALQQAELRFDYVGGENRKNDRRLVVFLMDQSGSLVGKDPFTGDVDLTKASDKDDQRISFMDQLVRNLPSDYLLSLVSFSGEFANITQELSTPSANKDPILEGIEELQFGELGATPLNFALKETLRRVIEQNEQAMNPVVVLFTDGVENGDPTGDLDEAIDRYSNRGDRPPIPVIVLHLQPPNGVDYPRGRDPKLAELACATGGDYIFLERADEFTISTDLQPAVQNRVVGVWRLMTNTGFSNAEFQPGGYLLSTELEVTLAGRSRSFALQRSRDLGDISDTRVWFFKE